MSSEIQTRKFGDLDLDAKRVATAMLLSAVRFTLKALAIECKGFIILFGDDIERMAALTNMSSENPDEDRRRVVKCLRNSIKSLENQDSERN